MSSHVGVGSFGIADSIRHSEQNEESEILRSVQDDGENSSGANLITECQRE